MNGMEAPLSDPRRRKSTTACLLAEVPWISVVHLDALPRLGRIDAMAAL